MPTRSAPTVQDYDVLVLVGGLLDGRSPLGSRGEELLKQATWNRIPIAALCTGSFILAELGLLDNYRASSSWFHINDFRKRFPAVEASADSLFIVDRDRATCAGGTGAADLAAHFVSRFLNEEKAEKAAKILLLDRVRNDRDTQPVNSTFARANSVVVRRALLLMESNLQRPLSIARIAKEVDRSIRQLERLFMAELGVSPRAAYMQLRIRRATDLIRSGKISIAEAAYEVGLINAGHFSRTFRKYAGISASRIRRQARSLDV